MKEFVQQEAVIDRLGAYHCHDIDPCGSCINSAKKNCQLYRRIVLDQEFFAMIKAQNTLTLGLILLMEEVFEDQRR